MTSPITESHAPGVPVPATSTAPAPEGPPGRGSQFPGTPVPPGNPPMPAAPQAGGGMEPAHGEPDSGDAAGGGQPLAVLEDAEGGTGERRLLPPTDAQDSDGTSGIHIDIRAGRNDGLIIGQLIEAVQRHSGAELRRDWIASELRDYVPYGNEAETGRLLRDNHVLVLYADHAGSGRWTAALRLLSALPETRLKIRRIKRNSGDTFSMAGLRRQALTGWILDLRDPGETIPAKSDFGHELSQADGLRADGSYLVVLTSTGLWEQISHGGEALARRLQPPDSREYFITLLSRSGVSGLAEWAEHFKPRIAGLRPAQVREWAEAFASGYSKFKAEKGREPALNNQDDVKAIDEVVRNAASGWMEVLAKWHEEPGRTSYDRNYLLLAAVHDGEPVDPVHRRVADLAKAIGEKGGQAEPLAGQEGPGLIQLARQIKAELLPDGHLRFPGPGFAEAVVRYFWLDRPHLSDAFMRWTVQRSRELPDQQGSQLAERMVPWVVHHAQATSSTRLLRLVAEEWSEGSHLAPHAHHLLVMASLDQEVGSRTRKAICSWASQETTKPALLQTLAGVFKTLAPAHTQMLSRLADLAQSPKEGVTDSVGEAINGLWDNEEFRPRLRDALIAWLGSGQEPQQRAAASAFLHLALKTGSDGQLTMLGELQDSASSWVIRSWRSVLEASQPTLPALEAFMAWLDKAATEEASTDRVFATLVSAVHDAPGDELRGLRLLNLGRLGEYWVVNSQVLDGQRRNEIRQELQRHTQLADPHRPRPREGDGTASA
jgi:hypothetical protein